MAETTSVKGKETGGMRAKRRILTVFATALFAILSFLIIYPLFAGLIASFRPSTELIRRGLSINLDFSTKGHLCLSCLFALCFLKYYFISLMVTDNGDGCC